ncbi:CD36, partial [Desmophyllum pertusum]
MEDPDARKGLGACRDWQICLEQILSYEEEGPSHITTRAYIWHITNKDGFLYRGEKPKLVEKGPYVYSTESKKVSVEFEKGLVTSKSFDKAKFNKALTEKECPKCREDDE